MEPDDSIDNIEDSGNRTVYFSAPGTPTGVDTTNPGMDESHEPSFYQDAKSPSEEPMDCDDADNQPSSTVESAGDQVSEDDTLASVSKEAYPLEAEPISSEADEGQEPCAKAVSASSPGYEHISSDEIDHDTLGQDKRDVNSSANPTSPSQSDLSAPEVGRRRFVPRSPSPDHSTDGELEDDVQENQINSSGLEPISPDSNLSGLNSKDDSDGALDDDDDLDLNEGAPPPRKSYRNAPDSSERDFLSGKNVSKEDDKRDDPHSLSKTSLHDDHGELDYDEEEMDEAVKELKGDAKDQKDEGEIDDKDDEGEIEKSDEGEISDEGSEEGEIKEPGSPKKQPFVPKSLCRFYNRGQCTWGNNCRFLHPGVNDKGNYSLIEQPGPAMNIGPPSMRGRIGPYAPDFGAPAEAEFPPPPPSPPATESAWERGLRHAKELRKKASKRREAEPDFEDKRLHLRVDVDVENKENDRNKATRDPYFEQQLEDEMYSSNKATEAWHGGQYENFEVRWSRDTEYREYRGDLRGRMRGDRGRERWEQEDDRKPHRRREEKYDRPFPDKPDKPIDRPPEKFDKPNRPPKDRISPDLGDGSKRAPRADTWNDPWSRAKSPKNKRPGSRSRSRSRGRRRHRSNSSYSSYSSSSYSSRSRSRSSSYSSYSSRSSISRSSSRYSSSSGSRSRTRSKLEKRPKGPLLGLGISGGGSGLGIDKKPPLKLGEAPKSAVMRPGAGGDKRRSDKPGKAGGPPGKAARPPGRAAGPPGRNAGPPGRNAGPPGRNAGPPGRNAGPPGRNAGPPGRHVGPPGRNAGPPGRGAGPSGRNAGSSGKVAGPPTIGGSSKPIQSAKQPRKPSPTKHKNGAPPVKGPMKPAREGPSSKSAPPMKGPQPLPKMAPVPKGPMKSEPPAKLAKGPLSGRLGKPVADERGRKRERLPPPGRGKKRSISASSSNSSYSRSRSSSRSLSVSSISSTGSSSSHSSSGSADSEHLYRDIDSHKKSSKSKKGDSRSGASKKPGPGAGPYPPRQAKPERNYRDGKDSRSVPSKDRPDRPVVDRGMGDRRGRAPPAAPLDRSSELKGKTSMQIQQSKAKDPMKMAGHKSSIKLTLRSDKNSSESGSGKKRPAPDAPAAPAAKKPAVKPTEPTKAPVRITLPKKEKLVPTSLSPKKEEKSPTKTGKSSSSGGSSKKKSMSSRREELLQQLKAVEDAIARKRAKMN